MVVLLVLPLAALVAGTLHARAAVEPAGGPRSDDDAVAVSLLRQAAEAAAEWSWSGTEFVSGWGAGGTVAGVVDVEHVAGRGTTIRTRGGPATALALSGVTPQRSDHPGLLVDAAVDRLMASYAVVLDGSGRVGGRPALVVAVRRDDGRPAARLWVDRATRLPLRREVYDSLGQVARASAFVDVRVGGRRQLPGGPRPTSSPTAAELAGLQAQGWLVPAALAGLPVDHAGLLRHAGADVLHLRYSDGLSSVSVFQQRGRLEPATLGGLRPWRPAAAAGATVYVRPGLPLSLTWESGGTVFTVVADASDEVVARVVAELPHTAVAAESRQDASGGGFADRLRRGAARLAGWLNPFD